MNIEMESSSLCEKKRQK